MTRKIIIHVLLSVVLLSLGTLNLSCTNNAIAENEPKPANVSLNKTRLTKITSYQFLTFHSFCTKFRVNIPGNEVRVVSVT